MNKNDHQRPKSRSNFKFKRVVNIIKEENKKEIKISLKNDLFLSKNKIFNKTKNNFFYKNKISPIESNKDKEINEKEMYYFKKDINSLPASDKIYKYTPKILSSKNEKNKNSNLFFNSIDKNIKNIKPNNEDLFPRLSAFKKLKSTDKINCQINKQKQKVFSISNNYFKNRIYSSKINQNLENKKNSFNSSYNALNNSNNNLISSLNDKPKINSYYKTYTYIIRPENCGYLIKKCFNHRINWVELPDMSQIDFNFKWQQNTKNLNFSTLSKVGHFKQMVNHFEYHSVITNKANLFLNLLRHAEWEEENVFKYIPFTVLFEYNSDNYFKMIDKFEYLFDNIEKYLVPFNEMDLNKYKYYKGRLYSSLFPYEDHLGNKTAINIPKTHFNDIKDNNKENIILKNNLWLVKAPDLNRGMCIQVVDNISLIKKHINSYYRGIQRGYNREETKNRLVNPISSSLRSKTTKNSYKINNLNINVNNINSNLSSKKKDKYEFNTEQAYY